MYNLSPALAADWRRWLEQVIVRLQAQASGRFEPVEIDVARESDLESFWASDRLLLSQTCGYPLTHALADRVQVVATPVFDAEGCEGADYRSVLVVRDDDPADTLAALRGRRAAINGEDSNSGFNVFRHVVAPLAIDGRFFSTVTTTRSHRASMEAVRNDVADIAAIDCVTYAFARDVLPDLTRGLRIIGHTVATPGLPLITSKQMSPDAVERLHKALDASLDEDRALVQRLKIRSFVRLSLVDYDTITRIEREAAQRGYSQLA